MTQASIVATLYESLQFQAFRLLASARRPVSVDKRPLRSDAAAAAAAVAPCMIRI